MLHQFSFQGTTTALPLQYEERRHHCLSRLSSTSLKEIMRHDPLFTILQSPQFRTRQEEESPIDIPLVLFSDSVGFRQDGFQCTSLPGRIQIVQPPVGRFFVIGPIDTPVLHHTKVLRKVQEQIVTRHGPPGKEIIAHPALIKVITKVLVGKNVNKQLSGWFEEGMDLVQQIVVIFHVFKHFDRHDQIIVLDDCQCTLVVGNVALKYVNIYVCVCVCVLCTRNNNKCVS